MNQSKKEEIQIIINYWIRTLHIKFGCIKNFNELVSNYVKFIYFYLSFNLNKNKQIYFTFTVHTHDVYSIDYSTFDDCQFICYGSANCAIHVWDIDNNKQIQLIKENLITVYCVKFSSYHYYNYRQNVICYSLFNKIIHCCDVRSSKKELYLIKGSNDANDSIFCIKFISLKKKVNGPKDDINLYYGSKNGKVYVLG
ncbi:hypothetical protein RFI_37072 [Reticulomyxa filosa]|uniref:WD repeat-containing protein n=1 Tax=Reticulomyxa filosa TaxID=46433 RepID=X6LI67_RETFI|nr:hypothetical protein RFI_37072 [Reticulomyxa filosa]|eukprot:ETO00375.1 hypothetical protein RFI_37072 [Reticulomyxa filosa]